MQAKGTKRKCVWLEHHQHRGEKPEMRWKSRWTSDQQPPGALAKPESRPHLRPSESEEAICWMKSSGGSGAHSLMVQKC